ncbi:MAG: tripartite tricarboxylate transporter substrate binding protein [Burkholderiales bacterium]|nr:tripartite tricarboxylate transporter substrate binding protein [Burkholderiales bacterium]
MTRTLLRWLLPAIAGLCAAAAMAQPYPSQPVKLIVPYPPGGNTDIVARLYAQKLSERLGQPVVIDNRGGAAGTLGVGIAAKSPNDGYTLVIGDLGSLVIGPLSKPSIGYDPQKDFAPVGLVSTVSIVVTANPKSGMNSMQDLLARAKAQPGKLNAGTGGQAGPGHLALELLRTMAGVDIVHVPFKGGAAATTALLGEQVDVVIDGSAMGQVKGGKLKAIAVTGPRLPALPDVPGIGETVKGYEFTNWWGILAPAGTPAAAIDRLNQELAAIAAMPDVRAKLADLGLAAKSSTPQQFADLIRTETDKVAKIVKDAGIKFE